MSDSAAEPTDDRRDAVRAVVPVLLAVLPFGIVYGAVAAQEGLTVLQTMGFSVAIFAGASQLAALQLMGIGAPIWSILLTIFALNFRHVLYSASISRHLGAFTRRQKAVGFFLLVDPLFGAAEVRAAARKLTPAFYFTYGVVMYAGWQIATFTGASFGKLISDPEALGLDFVLPVYFLGLVMSFRNRGPYYWITGTSLLASVVVFWLVGPPWHVSLGGLAGVGLAAFIGPSKPPADTAERNTQGETS